jgi:hypothetical protein
VRPDDVRRVVALLCVALAVGSCVPTGTIGDATANVSASTVLLLDRGALADARAGARSGRADLGPAIAELRREADVLVSATPVTVTDKATPAPSGDVHDYVSLSIYWWPDPAKPDGLPYLSKDGQIDPEASDTRRYDAAKLNRMASAVETLGLAAFITGDQTYAEATARWLRTWFLDEKTRMTPSMRYAQIIPGRPEPRGTGIIDSRQLMRAVDAALLIHGTAAWSPADETGLRAWFGLLADWLATSPQGKMEGSAKNNHGTWYDAQLADFALFARRELLAKGVLSKVGSARVAPQFAADGSQPQELARTRSYHYSAFNLLAFAILGDLGPVAGVDIWHGSGSGIRAGIDLLLPYVNGAKPWPYPDIDTLDYVAELAPILARASVAYPDAGYDAALTQLVARQGPLSSLRIRLGAFASLGGTAAAPVALTRA